MAILEKTKTLRQLVDSVYREARGGGGSLAEGTNVDAHSRKVTKQLLQERKNTQISF